MEYYQPFPYPLLLLLLLFPLCNSADTIAPNHSIKDGESLMSPNENFALGFFSPGNSKNRYVGIWYNKIPDQTVVWVANRQNPVRDSSGILTMKGGNLVLLDGGHNNNNTTLWSTNISTVSNHSNATLADSGNLVLTDYRGRILWKSFDYPTNTFLPGMKLGLDLRTGLNRVITSWKSKDDPSPGEFSFGADPLGVPQFFLRKGTDSIWRTGPWNGQRLSGVPVMNRDSIFHYSYVANNDEFYYTHSGNNPSLTSSTLLDHSGILQRLMWNDKNPRWNLMWVATQDRCDRYATCGVYGSCDSSRVGVCECLKGFEPRIPRDWHFRDWSGGCVRRRPLDCGGKGDGFFRLARVKLPNTSGSRVEPGLNLEACELECLKNCSCTAYASANITEGGSGCFIWDGDLVDLRVYSDGGQDIYVRVAASELGKQDFRDYFKIISQSLSSSGLFVYAIEIIGIIRGIVSFIL